MNGPLLTPDDVARHFGISRQEAAAQIRATPGHIKLNRKVVRLPAELLALCQPPPAPKPRPIPKAPRPPSDLEALLRRRVRRAAIDGPVFDDLDCTYIVHAPAAGLVKIGKTRNLGKRFGVLAALSPVEIVLIAQLRARRLEGVLHKRFSAARRHSEWFTAEPVLEFLRGCGLLAHGAE